VVLSCPEIAIEAVLEKIYGFFPNRFLRKYRGSTEIIEKSIE